MSTLSEFDQAFFDGATTRLAGVDEVGRGPLAGPVVASACVMPAGIQIHQLDDSKRLSPVQRFALNRQIREHPQIAFALGWVPAEEIDASNIHLASLKAMGLAIDDLGDVPDALLVDGRFLPGFQGAVSSKIPRHRCQALICGDGRSQVIAAASVLAKVARDAYMTEQDQRWPEYGFARHKGYATPQHLEALARWGPCPLHRQSFRPISERVGLNSQKRRAKSPFIERREIALNAKKSHGISTK